MSAMIRPKSFIIFQYRSIVKNALDMFVELKQLLKTQGNVMNISKRWKQLVLSNHN